MACGWVVTWLSASAVAKILTRIRSMGAGQAGRIRVTQRDNGDYSDLIPTNRLFCERAKPSKWPRRCSRASRASAGRPAAAHIAKNHAHPVAAAIKPAPEER